MFYAIRNNSKITANPVILKSYTDKIYCKTKPVYKVDNIPVYKNVVDSQTGQITKVATGKSFKGLKQVGEVNVYEKIQVAAKGMDIYSILDRCSRGLIGDISFNQSEFVDVAGYPKDIIEVHQTMKAAEKEFNDVSPELKNLFGNDPLTFLKNFSLDKLADYAKSKEVKKDGE